MLDINKLVNVPTSLNNLKTKVDNSDVGILKSVSVDLHKLNDVVDNEVVKNTKFNTPDASTLIWLNQYNTDKQNLGKTTDQQN